MKKLLTIAALLISLMPIAAKAEPYDITSENQYTNCTNQVIQQLDASSVNGVSGQIEVADCLFKARDYQAFISIGPTIADRGEHLDSNDISKTEFTKGQLGAGNFYRELALALFRTGDKNQARLYIQKASDLQMANCSLDPLGICKMVTSAINEIEPQPKRTKTENEEAYKAHQKQLSEYNRFGHWHHNGGIETIAIKSPSPELANFLKHRGMPCHITSSNFGDDSILILYYGCEDGTNNGDGPGVLGSELHTFVNGHLTSNTTL